MWVCATTPLCRVLSEPGPHFAQAARPFRSPDSHSSPKHENTPTASLCQTPGGDRGPGPHPQPRGPAGKLDSEKFETGGLEKHCGGGGGRGPWSNSIHTRLQKPKKASWSTGAGKSIRGAQGVCVAGAACASRGVRAAAWPQGGPEGCRVGRKGLLGHMKQSGPSFKHFSKGVVLPVTPALTVLPNGPESPLLPCGAALGVLTAEHGFQEVGQSLFPSWPRESSELTGSWAAGQQGTARGLQGA